jgi:hypothetical protein
LLLLGDTLRRLHSRLSNSRYLNPIRKCSSCRGTHTYIKKTKNGTPYEHWYCNPYEEDAWPCGGCHKFWRTIGKIPATELLAKQRDLRLSQRTCCECKGKTQIQHVRSSYHIWHHYPEKGCLVMCQMLCRTVLCSKKEIQDKERALRRSIRPHVSIKFFQYLSVGRIR